MPTAAARASLSSGSYSGYVRANFAIRSIQAKSVVRNGCRTWFRSSPVCLVHLLRRAHSPLLAYARTPVESAIAPLVSPPVVTHPPLLSGLPSRYLDFILRANRFAIGFAMLRLVSLLVLIVAVTAISYDQVELFVIPSGDLQGSDQMTPDWSLDDDVRISPKFLPRRSARREQKRIRPCFFSPIQCLMKRSYG